MPVPEKPVSPGYQCAISWLSATVFTAGAYEFRQDAGENPVLLRCCRHVDAPPPRCIDVLLGATARRCLLISPLPRVPLLRPLLYHLDSRRAWLHVSNTMASQHRISHVIGGISTPRADHPAATCLGGGFYDQNSLSRSFAFFHGHRTKSVGACASPYCRSGYTELQLLPSLFCHIFIHESQEQAGCPRRAFIS